MYVTELGGHACAMCIFPAAVHYSV